MATIKVNYDALQRTSADLVSESKRVFKLALEMERIMVKIPMKTTSQSLAKLKMARQCVGVTAASAKLMRFGVLLEELGNLYKDSDHRTLVGGDAASYAKYLAENTGDELSDDDLRRMRKVMEDVGEKIHDGITNVKEHFSNYWKVFTETNFNKMSNEELRAYFDELTKRINENGLNEDDSIRLKALLKHLSKDAFNNRELYYDVFELVNAEEANRINEYINGKGYSGNKALWIKYFMSKGTSAESAEALYKKWTNNSNHISDINMLNDFSDDESFRQGNFHIGDISTSKNSDGSCNISFSARQTSAAKSYGAVIVYDSEGNIQEIKVLDRYHNPTGPIEACKTIWKGWHNEDYAETNVNVSVPKGGYVQITDDPDEIAIIQTGKIGEEIVSDQVKDVIKDELVDWIKEKTGIGQVGKHATDAVKYRAEVIAQAKEAYEISKKSAEIMDKIENIYWSADQKGSGSVVIYNN